ncbi:uncharacterized protein LOC134283005 [Saccostrea cucullata]|uniref:uncharacterized protein LOC134283005 n=1 Tax=Saccostrea cuccullata TaxID=36930 RepID=UPI002ED1D12B
MAVPNTREEGTTQSYFVGNSCIICGFSFELTVIYCDGTSEIKKLCEKKLKLNTERKSKIEYAIEREVRVNDTAGCCQKCFRRVERIIKIECDLKRKKRELAESFDKTLNRRKSPQPLNKTEEPNVPLLFRRKRSLETFFQNKEKEDIDIEEGREKINQSTADRVAQPCKRHYADSENTGSEADTAPPNITTKYRRILPMPDNTKNTAAAEETVWLVKTTESCTDHMTEHDKQSAKETLDLVKVSDQSLSPATEFPLHPVKTEPVEETRDSKPVDNQDLKTPQDAKDNISSVQVLHSAIGVTFQPVKTEPEEETIKPEPIANQKSQEISTNQSSPADVSPIQVLQSAIGIILQPALDPLMVANKNSQNVNTNHMTDSLYIVTTNQINPIGVLPVCQMPIQQ